MNKEEYLARSAYNAYCDACNWKTFQDSPMSIWQDLDPEDKETWFKMSRNVIRNYNEMKSIEDYKQECVDSNLGYYFEPQTNEKLFGNE